MIDGSAFLSNTFFRSQAGIVRVVPVGGVMLLGIGSLNREWEIELRL